MKAVVCQAGNLKVADIPNPQPGPGQILLNVKRAGICGSDVHLRDQIDHVTSAATATGQSGFGSSSQEIVFGHEFSGEVLEYGPDTNRRWKPGTLLVAMPMCRHHRHPNIIGSTPDAPGAYAEQMIVQESVAFPVPNGLAAELATLTEPMSVAWHGVQRSRIKNSETAYVIGCGPVGLAVIAMLKAAGVETIIASDLSPKRRELASLCGADVVVNPTTESPFMTPPLPARTTWFTGMFEFPNVPWSVPGAPEDLNLALDTMEKLRKPVDAQWWEVFKTMHEWRKNPKGPVVFECSGASGMIDSLIADAPPLTRIVVVGSCLKPDTFRPILSQLKEVELIFAVGYTPGEFRDVLHMIADGKVNPAPLITGTVGFEGVEAAFDALQKPEKHAKILIDPQSTISTI